MSPIQPQVAEIIKTTPSCFGFQKFVKEKLLPLLAAVALPCGLSSPPNSSGCAFELNITQPQTS